MYSWACTCGDGGAANLPSWTSARLEGEIHTCRMGRLRAEHVITVRQNAYA